MRSELHQWALLGMAAVSLFIAENATMTVVCLVGVVILSGLKK